MINLMPDVRTHRHAIIVPVLVCHHTRGDKHAISLTTLALHQKQHCGELAANRLHGYTEYRYCALTS